jgi:anaerobic selenocysteine-containing dehydrogenase
MDRRNFFKIVSTVSAGMATSACGDKTNHLIPLLVPDHEIVPGAEQWHAAVCGECSAGCGTIVRVMEGERIIERNSEKFRERIACVKKIEGNPLDPVSGGRLCALGHAALQSLYNPDRLQGPLKRTGERGNTKFQTVSWDEAIGTVAEKLSKARLSDPSRIACLTGSQMSSRSLTLQSFLQALGAPGALTCSMDSFALERKAAEIVFGWKGLPVYDLARAHHALGVGADFLGGWASPVYYARQFGQFRQGRSDVRGMLAQAESRMSLTAARADEWLPVRPGSEPQFILAIAHLLLHEKLARHAEDLPAAVAASIESADLASLITACGIEEKRLRKVARALGESEAPLVIAGASLVHTNSLDALVAAHYLNLMLGNIGKPGGVLPPNPEPFAIMGDRAGDGKIADVLKRARVLLLDGENPVYTLPVASGVRQALAGMELIVSFGGFINDSAAYADLILPDHHTLESELAIAPAVSPRSAINVTTSFVRPLYNTQSLEHSLSAIARKMTVAFVPQTPREVVEKSLPQGHTWDNVVQQGGFWPDDEPKAAPVKASGEKLQTRSAAFAGSPQQFPFQFQPYASLQYHDGRGANLPWMQELPDPASSAMWDLPVEIDPQTAAKLNVVNGDRVKVESPHGSLEAWVYVHPAALPGVVSMAIGEGHTHYGRYASLDGENPRGANPLAIAAPVLEESTGTLAAGATRVRLARVDSAAGELIQFSPQDREQGPWGRK